MVVGLATYHVYVPIMTHCVSQLRCLHALQGMRLSGAAKLPGSPGSAGSWMSCSATACALRCACRAPCRLTAKPRRRRHAHA